MGSGFESLMPHSEAPHLRVGSFFSFPNSSTERPILRDDHSMDDVSAGLDAEYARTIARLGDLNADFAAMVAASVDSNADDEHDPEGSTIAFERSQIDALINQAEHHLDDIAIARQRLADGSYEVCESCGKPIGKARLTARPVARLCIDCASRGAASTAR